MMTISSAAKVMRGSHHWFRGGVILISINLIFKFVSSISIAFYYKKV